jgi:hypothetical protein
MKNLIKIGLIWKKQKAKFALALAKIKKVRRDAREGILCVRPLGCLMRAHVAMRPIFLRGDLRLPPRRRALLLSRGQCA